MQQALALVTCTDCIFCAAGATYILTTVPSQQEIQDLP